jgi:hypothetical protein
VLFAAVHPAAERLAALAMSLVGIIPGHELFDATRGRILWAAAAHAAHPETFVTLLPRDVLSVRELSAPLPVGTMAVVFLPEAVVGKNNASLRRILSGAHEDNWFLVTSLERQSWNVYTHAGDVPCGNVIADVDESERLRLYYRVKQRKPSGNTHSKMGPHLIQHPRKYSGP